MFGTVLVIRGRPVAGLGIFVVAPKLCGVRCVGVSSELPEFGIADWQVASSALGGQLTTRAVDQSWWRSPSTKSTNLARCDPGQ